MSLVQFDNDWLRHKQSRLNTKGIYIFTNGVAGAIFYKEMVKPKQSINHLWLKRDSHGNWVKIKKE